MPQQGRCGVHEATREAGGVVFLERCAELVEGERNVETRFRLEFELEVEHAPVHTPETLAEI